MTSGYACPVCDTPQRDAEHLANHLAFTAMLRAGEHEAWLDEHVPDWSAAGPDELAERVVEYADDAEYREVFEDTVARGAAGGRGGPDGTGHDHGDRGRPSIDAADVAGGDRGYGGGDPGRPGDEGVSDDTAAVVEEARELTRRMYEDDESTAGTGSDGADRSDDTSAGSDGEGQES